MRRHLARDALPIGRHRAPADPRDRNLSAGRQGPFPLIVFAHGFAGHPDKFTKLFAAWAAGGYVVAAPAFPLTNDHVTIDGGDAVNQPADVSFVLDEVLALGKRRGSRLFHAVKRSRIGAAGLSLGGVTTYSVV